MYDAAIFGASLVFLAGTVMMVLSAFEWATRRVPRLLLWGFATVALSFGLVLAAWWGLRP